MRYSTILLFSTSILFVYIAGCDPYAGLSTIGQPCSREAGTICRGSQAGLAGPCLLDLPNGMCSYDCSENAEGCPPTYTCASISGGRYCLQSCEEDSDCRSDLICVVGECRGPGRLGDPCEEPDDCGSGYCHDGACSIPCDRQSDCPDGVTCVDLGDGSGACVDLDYGDECETNGDCASGICFDGQCNVECHAARDCPSGLACLDLGDGVPICVAYDPPTGGDGMWGASCTFADCADGFECVSRTPDPSDDPYAYCTRSCLNDLDCPSDMTCRRSQLGDDTDMTLRCVPRGYCERCASDDQCSLSGGKCVSQSPERGPGRYCSQSCDPEAPVTTCPTDSTCHEALWCQPDRAWVADCEWCSDPERCGSADGGPIYQCFHDYGACAGSGDDYCAPCWVDADCPEGGRCFYDPYMANSFCTMPCREEGGELTCPPEHYCVQFGLGYENDFECMPRQGSCSQPSGGRRTCEVCHDFGDCISGQCLPENLDPSRQTVCYEDCSAGPQECPPYTQCNEYRDADDNPVFLCTRSDDLRSCAQVLNCLDDCPEGPDSCSDDARTYCY